MKKLYGFLPGVVFLLALAIGGILLFLLPKKDYSNAERRPLAEAPEASFDALYDGRFFTQADKWAADHFAGREFFRSVKAHFQTNVLLEIENNGLAVVDGSIVRLEKEIDEASLSYAAECFRGLYDRYLAGTDCQVFCALVPDKSYFLSQRGYPVMNLKEMERRYYGALPEARQIDLKNELSLGDYYSTDSHWKQENIINAANLILRSMGKEGDLTADGFEKNTYAPFYGVYALQSALDPMPDAITYLTGGPIKDVRVLDFSSMGIIPAYDPDGCDERDPYTLFLGGAKGFLRIENPNVTGGELIVFRDSFGSSIAPLLAARYSAVTLIDTRYFHPSLLKNYLRFTDQDVLFLYSSTLLNNSQGLK